MVGPTDGHDESPPDVLDSSPTRTVGPWLIALVVLVIVAVGGVLVYGGGDAEESAEPPPVPTTTPVAAVTTTVTPTTPAARRPPLTSHPIDPADITEGVLPASFGLPIGTTALQAAQAVADGYCAQIASWVIKLEPIDEYDDVIALLRPSGPAYPTVSLQIELIWDGSRYTWRASRSALERCP